MQRKMGLLGPGLVLFFFSVLSRCLHYISGGKPCSRMQFGWHFYCVPVWRYLVGSGAVGVRADGSWWATDEKTLEVIVQTTNQGNDTIGEFTSYEYTWKAVSDASAFDLQVNTYINEYTDVPVVVFAIAYITAANNTAIPKVYNRTVSSFPSFIIEETQVKRGYTTWEGNSNAAITVMPHPPRLVEGGA